jgi:hypothetical protein
VLSSECPNTASVSHRNMKLRFERILELMRMKETASGKTKIDR